MLSSVALCEAGNEPSEKGLVWAFYHNPNFSDVGDSGVDEQVNFSTGTIFKDYSRCWLGYIKAPAVGEVSFDAEADNGLRLWIADRLVIDGWSEDGARSGTHMFQKKDERVPFRLEFFQDGGTAHMRLFWHSPDRERQLVPPEAFRHSKAQADTVRTQIENMFGKRSPIDNSRIYQPGERTPREKPLELAPGPHLLIDDYYIERSENIERVVNKPERDPAIPNPIVDGPEDACFQPYMSILRNPSTGKFRIWFGCWSSDLSFTQSLLGYMTSDDGIHWQRPKQILEGMGEIQFGISVIDDGLDFPVPEQRFKFGWYAEGGLKIAVSPDGLQWTPLTGNVAVRHNHDITAIFHDPIRKRYIGIVSSGENNENWSGRRRITRMTHSKDLLYWAAPARILTPDDKLDDGETQFYAMDGFIVRGDFLIGMVKVLRDDLKADDPPDPPEAYGVGYTALAWTRDGETWYRDQAHFFDPHPKKGAWDHAHAWIDEQLPVGDEVYLYYGGYKSGHKVNRFEERQIGLVKMERDRYVARASGAKEGRLLTPLMKLAGSALSVNVETAGGSVRAQLLDGDGKPIPGFALDDCLPITGDELNAPLRWKTPLNQLEGRPVRIEFVMQNARLFAFYLEK